MGGRLYGKQFLKPESVCQMTTVQTGERETGFALETAGAGAGAWYVSRKE